MNVKEELNQYRFKIKNAEKMKEEYEKFMTRATKMTASFDGAGVSKNKVSDKVGEFASALADLENEWKKRWLEAEKERLRLYDAINEIGEPHRTVLIGRYIEQKSFEEIATEMEYSYAWVTHLHGEALEKFKATQKMIAFAFTYEMAKHLKIKKDREEKEK